MVHNLQQLSLHLLPRPGHFEHVTSSPRYAQANGKAENAVKTVKRMFTKCKEGRQSEYLALLNWRNTPSEGFGTSPAQRLMGRRCKTTLPIAGKLLQPRSTTEQDSEALLGMKAKQEHYYNQSAKPLPELNPGNTIRIRLRGDKKWTRGVCKEKVGPRSFEVEANGAILWSTAAIEAN